MDKGENTEREDENKWTDKQTCVEVQIADNPVDAFSHCYPFVSLGRLRGSPVTPAGGLCRSPEMATVKMTSGVRNPLLQPA
jgi:hypothetical protein